MLMTKGAAWGDIDGDRYPELYVSNINGDNRLYKNNGNGTFSDIAVELNVGGPKRSFPVWFWDYNNDGALDLFVSSYSGGAGDFVHYFRGERLDDFSVASLYEGDGQGGFRNVVRERGLDVPMQTMGSNFGDLDNDGFPDMYLGTGTPNYSDVVPNLLLVNRGGKHFEDVTAVAGMGHLQKGHAVAFADFDRDGDLDVFEVVGGALKGDAYYDALFENPGFENRHWIEIRLKGVQSNSFGVGARIRAVIEEENVERSVYALVGSGGSFGGNPLVQHLGLGISEVIERLEIFWPVTGVTQVIESIPVDQRIVVTEGKRGWEKSK